VPHCLFRSAKTAVSAAQQADAAALARVYDDMAAQLSAGGLNLPAIQAQGCAALLLPATLFPSC
jgi:hypothetical protein